MKARCEEHDVPRRDGQCWVCQQYAEYEQRIRADERERWANIFDKKADDWEKDSDISTGALCGAYRGAARRLRANEEG